MAARSSYTLILGESPQFVVEFQRRTKDGTTEDVGHLLVDFDEGNCWQDGEDRVTLNYKPMRNDVKVVVDLPTGTVLR